TDDHYACGLSLRLLGDRNDDRLSRRDIPISRGQLTEAGREIGHDHGVRFRQRLANRPLAPNQPQQRRRRAMVRANPRAASERGLLAPALQQVDEREWQVARISGEAFGHRGEKICLALTVWDPRTNLAQYSQPSLADKTLGVLDNDAKMSSDAARVIRQGAVRKSMKGFFRISGAQKNQRKVLVICGAADSQHFLDSRPDVAPDFLPYVPRGSAQSPRILGPQRRTICII